MALFYLGSERFLDSRYLEHDSEAASWSGLAFDVLCLSVTSLWFIVIARSLPQADALSAYAACTADACRDALVTLPGSRFLRNLVLLYVLDLILLLMQILRLRRSRIPAQKQKELFGAHQIWIAINLVCACFTWVLVYRNPGGWHNPIPAVILFVIHVARFLWTSNTCSTTTIRRRDSRWRVPEDLGRAYGARRLAAAAAAESPRCGLLPWRQVKKGAGDIRRSLRLTGTLPALKDFRVELLDRRRRPLLNDRRLRCPSVIHRRTRHIDPSTQFLTDTARPSSLSPWRIVSVTSLPRLGGTSIYGNGYPHLWR